MAAFKGGKQNVKEELGHLEMIQAAGPWNSSSLIWKSSEREGARINMGSSRSRGWMEGGMDGSDLLFDLAASHLVNSNPAIMLRHFLLE